jgi:hypothetical protein
MVPNQFITTLLVFLIAAFIGLTIIQIVDSRMSDISINMPKITLPPQHITIKMQDSQNPQNPPKPFTVKQESPNTYQLTKPDIHYNTLKTLVKTQNQKGGAGEAAAETEATGDKQVICKSELFPRQYDSSKYRSQSKNIVAPPVTVPKPSRDHQSRPAPYPRNKKELDKVQNITYYKNPKDMTPEQVLKFKNNGKFINMTVKDYENWLLLFRDEPQNLTGFHRGNLKILLRGGDLTASDLPAVTPLPRTSDHEYIEKVSQGTYVQDNIPQPENLGYQASNYDMEVGSSIKERTMKHLAYINPDEPLKTWILTHESNQKL